MWHVLMPEEWISTSYLLEDAHTTGQGVIRERCTRPILRSICSLLQGRHHGKGSTHRPYRLAPRVPFLFCCPFCFRD